MPTDSQRETIIAQLVTTLAAITAGATYFNTFRTVDRKVRNILEIPEREMPALMVVDETENIEPSSAAHDLITIPLAIPFVRTTTAGGAVASRDGNRMIVDIQRALLAFDETIVNSAVVSVVLTGSSKVLTELQVDDPPHLPIIVGEVRANMSFRVQIGDPGVS